MDIQLEQAKNILEAEQLTCCMVNGKDIFKSTRRGVAPLLSLIEEKGTMKGYFSADKVVGKAAAFLYVLLDVSAVYAYVISEKALEVFEKNGIAVFYKTSVPAIINRAGDGFCPMETAVSDVQDADIALARIKQKLLEIKNAK